MSNLFFEEDIGLYFFLACSKESRFDIFPAMNSVKDILPFPGNKNIKSLDKRHTWYGLSPGKFDFLAGTIPHMQDL
jgi:hypothetical protein